MRFQEKQLTSSIGSGESCAFKQKLEFWEICIYCVEHDSLSVFTEFSDKIGHDINMWFVCVWMFYNEIFA